MWYVGKHPPYIDRGRPGPRFESGGALVLMKGKLPQLYPRKMTPEELQRYSSLDPELQGTLRVLLRWSERAGMGEFNPEAEIRETHYDPLPPDIQERVTAIVDTSPWPHFLRKLVMTTLAKGSLAEQLGMAKRTFYSERKNALWYCRGRFEGEHIYG
jgi:hypothetical protein